MDLKYVSRGGLKLEHALKEFGVDVTGKTVLDVGSSTGGFVDCLLQHGAKKVYALDTAYGEFAWKLRNDSRVIVMERQNILFLESLPEQVDLVTIDVSFTSLTKVLPIVKKFLDPSTEFTPPRAGLGILALVKPQYEDQKLALKYHGVIPESFHPEILANIKEFTKEAGFQFLGLTPSPILGGEGNREFFIILSDPAKAGESKDLVDSVQKT
ncbi:TlyA family RNA methyltransferase [Candidatus Microgenomates bacterium]|nr:TlyA family RNA methyltransferase [Candidatus Microgenomates bacterium]